MSQPPSAYVLQRVISEAQQALVSLRDEHGQIIEGPDEVLAALSDESIDAAGLLRRLGQAALDAKAYAAAAETRISDLEARHDRFKRQEAKYRELLLMAAQALETKKFADAELSFSISPGKPRVIITDADKLADELVKIEVVRTPVKDAIRTAIEDRNALIATMRDQGEEPPGEIEGAILSNGPPTLTIRSR